MNHELVGHTSSHVRPDRLEVAAVQLHVQIECGEHTANQEPFVFVRVDIVKKPLQPPYDGPYKVLKRKPKYFILNRNGTKVFISIDRLKPAYLEPPATPAPAVRTHLSSSTTQSSKDTTPSFPTTTILS